MNACVAKKRTKQGDRYYVVVETGRTPEGKPIKKWEPGGYRTVTEARKAARAAQLRLEQGSYVEPSKLQLADYLQEWITAAQGTGRIRPGTAALYETVRRAYVVPTVGHLSLQELKATHLDAAYAQLMTRGGRGGRWRLIAMTGMRRGELLGLRYRDLDLERGHLSITQTRW